MTHPATDTPLDTYIIGYSMYLSIRYVYTNGVFGITMIEVYRISL